MTVLADAPDVWVSFQPNCRRGAVSGLAAVSYFCRLIQPTHSSSRVAGDAAAFGVWGILQPVDRGGQVAGFS